MPEQYRMNKEQYLEFIEKNNLVAYNLRDAPLCCWGLKLNVKGETIKVAHVHEDRYKGIIVTILKPKYVKHMPEGAERWG